MELRLELELELRLWKCRSYCPVPDLCSNNSARNLELLQGCVAAGAKPSSELRPTSSGRELPKSFNSSLLKFESHTHPSCSALYVYLMWYLSGKEDLMLMVLPNNQHKTLDVITLFHKPSSAASMRVHSILKQASAQAGESATIDQASDHTEQTRIQGPEFELDVVEDAPTPDQLTNILDYIGGQNAGQVIKGAKDAKDAMKKLKENAENFQRPVVSAVSSHCQCSAQAGREPAASFKHTNGA